MLRSTLHSSLVLGLVTFAAASWAGQTHRVEVIAGSGHRPANLVVGQRLSRNTRVTADKDTLIVLKKSWTVESGPDYEKICSEWVILRGDSFRVDDENPRPCPTGGDPGALTVAMNQQRKLSRYVVLGGVSERGDDPIPEAPEFMDALYELHEQGLPAPAPPEQEPQPPQPDAVSAVDACERHVQGRIAWNLEGDEQWGRRRLASLCGGARPGHAAEPARCFESTKRLARGEDWDWQSAARLCRGLADARRAISCLRAGTHQGVPFAVAVQRCNRGPDPVVR